MDHPIIFSPDMVDAIGAGRKTQTRRLMVPQPKPCNHTEYTEAPWKDQPVLWSEHGLRLGHAFCSYCGNGSSVKKPGFKCPYGKPGDKLYVREKWKLVGWDFEDGEARIQYSDGVTVTHDLPDDDGQAYDWLVKQFEKLLSKEIIQPSEGCDVSEEECIMEFVKDKEHPFSPSIHIPKWCSRHTLDFEKLRVERLQDISEEDAIAEGILPVDAKLGEDTGYTDYMNGGSPYMSARNSYFSLWQKLHGIESLKANPFVWVIDFK